MAVPNLDLTPEEPEKPEAQVATEKLPVTFKAKKWVPQTWKTIYDEMVFQFVMGKNVTEIAKQYGKSREHVSTIVHTPQAKLLRRQLLTNLQKGIELRTEERLAHLSDRALARITAFIEEDKYMEATPIAVVDRSIAVLRGTGVLRSDSGSNVGVNAKNAVFVTSELAALLGSGLKMAEEAKRLNSSNAVETSASVRPKD